MGRIWILIGLGLLWGWEARAAFPTPTPIPFSPLVTESLQSHGFKETPFRRFEDYVFSEDGEFSTDSMVVLHRGKLIFERYANNYTPEMRHIGWSVTKSVLMALVGISEKEGRLKRTDLVTKFFPNYASTPWQNVKIENLLSMSSGMEWNEGYESSPFKSNVVAMLYRFPMMADMATYRLSRIQRSASPGLRFNYSSGDSNLISKILKRAWGNEYSDMPWKKLFHPIKASSFVMEQDISGTFVASSYSYATPRDYARFGQLFLQNGFWDGQSVLPHDWARVAQAPSPALLGYRDDHSPKAQSYGHGFWLNKAMPDALVTKRVQSAGEDLYWAEGHDGQYVFIWPSKEIVIARFGNDRYSKVLDLGRFFYLLNEALP